MSDVDALNAVVGRLVGKEIVGARLSWYEDRPDELRIKFYGGEELHVTVGGCGDTAFLSLDLIPNREGDK